MMNLNCETTNVKIICKVKENSSKQTTNTTKSPKIIELNKLTTYDDFIILLQNSDIINHTNNFSIFLNEDNDEKITVDLVNFDQIRERVIVESREKEIYFLVESSLTNFKEKKQSLQTVQDLKTESNYYFILLYIYLIFI